MAQVARAEPGRAELSRAEKNLSEPEPSREPNFEKIPSRSRAEAARLGRLEIFYNKN